jgi:tetratricopeptide (TPR) repeat protein
MSSKQLNNQGYELYKGKKYSEALKYFDYSIKKDNSNYLAHYNYACTLSLLITFGNNDYDLCEEHVTLVVNHLKKAIQLKPDYISKIRIDNDLNIIKRYFYYYELIGFNVANSNELNNILSTVEWGSDDQGRSGSGFGITFKKNGNLIFWHIDFTKDDYPKISTSGKYSVDTNINNTIMMYFDKPLFGSSQAKGALSKEGLSIKIGNNFNKIFKDKIFRCDH